MLAERLLARAWVRSQSISTQPEGFLEDGLAMVLETTDLWPRLVTHFRWPVPVGPFLVSTQDRVSDGRSDLRLRFADGRQVVLELKAGAAPDATQLRKYAEPGVQVIGLATTHRRYTSPDVVGTTTWADLVRLPWPTPPLAWRQFAHLAHAVGVAVPPVDVAALVGLHAAYDAQSTISQWAEAATDRLATLLSGDGVRFVVKNDVKRARRFTERAHRRDVAWVWPLPWKQHPFAGVHVGLFFGHPGVPVLVAGLPDIRICWQCNPITDLSRTITNDELLAERAREWATREGDTVRAWEPTGWTQLAARTSSAILLGKKEPGKTLIDWSESIVEEWTETGVLRRLRAHLLPVAAVQPEDDADPSGTDPAQIETPA